MVHAKRPGNRPQARAVGAATWRGGVVATWAGGGGNESVVK
tara:strand:- start:234 stop:356 length:123 start_codon:yes stop_codon:yes gene_type:complete